MDFQKQKKKKQRVCVELQSETQPRINQLFLDAYQNNANKMENKTRVHCYL